MKKILKALIYLSLLLTFSFSASAQFIPDSARIAVGLEVGYPTASISGDYVASAGASVRYERPFSKKSYITASIGYNSFFLANGIVTTQQAILNYPIHNLQTMPLKLGYKYFLIKSFYVAAELGETVILNKAAEFAAYSSTFTYAPQIGFVFKIKKHPHSYVDTGIRYEGVSSPYFDNDKYNFWAFHIAYSFNL